MRSVPLRSPADASASDLVPAASDLPLVDPVIRVSIA
jgi:hypothetical protein